MPSGPRRAGILGIAGDAILLGLFASCASCGSLHGEEQNGRVGDQFARRPLGVCTRTGVEASPHSGIPTFRGTHDPAILPALSCSESIPAPDNATAVGRKMPRLIQ